MALKRLLAILLAALAASAGCLAPIEEDNLEAGPQPMTVSGTVRVAAPLVVCEPGVTCHYMLPEMEAATFIVPVEGHNASLVASWTSQAHEPQQLAVHVVLANGGTWGHAEGPSPPTVPLSSPLVAGSYEIWAWVPPELWAGPVDVVLEWEVSYEVS